MNGPTSLAVQTFGDVQTMSSREIADLTGKRHDHVMVDIRKMLAELGKAAPDFSGAAFVNGPNGSTREIEVFNLQKRETLILVSGYSVAMRAKIIDRWQELEAKQAPAINLRDPRQLAAAALQLLEVNQELQAKVDELAPKAEALDLISAGDKSVTITEAAKLLSIKQKDLSAYLHAQGWVYRLNGSWVGYDQHIRNGNLEYKEHRFANPDTGQPMCRPYCHITPKGMTRLAEMLTQISRGLQPTAQPH